MTEQALIYGAESLKQNQLKHTFLAQLLAIGLIVGIFLFPLLMMFLEKNSNKSQLPVKAKKVIDYSELSAPPPIELEKVPPPTLKAPPKVKTIKFLQPVAKKDEEVIEEEDLPSMEDMSKTQIGDFDQDGIDSVVVGADESIEVIAADLEEEVFTFVETMPEFPGGGESAFLEYLSENIKYPVIAKETGIEGTVFIKFVIETDGSIGNVQILRGVTSALDNEALRVIKKMPPWKPGKQNGREVRVSYTVPIRFSLIGN
jgi:protein TonB